MALKLYSKLDSAADVISPQIGVGGSIFGSPTFIPCKYDNGIYANDDPTSLDGCSFPLTANEINMDEGNIKIWVKLKFSSGQSGAHVVWDFRKHNGAFYRGIYLDFVFWEAGTSLLRAICRHATGIILIKTDPFSFAIDDLMHLAVAWERTGTKMPAGKTFILYKDEVEIDHSHITWDEELVIASSLHLRSRIPGSPHPPRMVEDDLRVYNDWEGTEVPPIVGAPTNLLCEQLVNPINVSDPNPEFSAIHRVTIEE